MSVNEWQDLFVKIGTGAIGLFLAISQLSIIWKMKRQEKKDKAKEDEHKNYGNAIKTENKFAMQIQNQIEELRQSLNASAVQVIEFHNGTDFSTRKGYKLDCTYEALKYGHCSLREILMDYPTTMLPIFMNKIIEEKHYFISNIDDIDRIDMSTYAMKLNTNVAAFYDVLLEKDGMPIGILAVQYEEPASLTDADIAKIHAKKIILENLV